MTTVQDQQPSSGGVFISSTEMYHHVQQLSECVAGMDFKLDALACQSKKLEDHENRLRDLEERRLPPSALAWAGLLVAIMAAVVSVIIGR
jgi:hypothetical protein